MHRLLPLGCLMIALTATARAVDVSGIYENAGNRVGASAPAEAGPISFQGLLGLEFDYALTRALHSQVDRVVVRQADNTFTIECKDRDGATTWSGQWKINEGYGFENDCVKLLLRSRRYPNDGFFFALSPAADGQLLLLEVQRVNSTWFGPVPKQVGTFLFHRITGAGPRP